MYFLKLHFGIGFLFNMHWNSKQKDNILLIGINDTSGGLYYNQMIALTQKYIFDFWGLMYLPMCVCFIISQCQLYVTYVSVFFLSTISMEVVYKVNERTHFLFNVCHALFTHLTHITLVFMVIFNSVTYRVPTSSGNHGKPGKSLKKVPCMEKSWNLKKTE